MYCKLNSCHQKCWRMCRNRTLWITLTLRLFLIFPVQIFSALNRLLGQHNKKGNRINSSPVPNTFAYCTVSVDKEACERDASDHFECMDGLFRVIDDDRVARSGVIDTVSSFGGRSRLVWLDWSSGMTDRCLSHLMTIGKLSAALSSSKSDFIIRIPFSNDHRPFQDNLGRWSQIATHRTLNIHKQGQF